MSDILWCCHVRGPDDVYPAPDYATALKWADVTNAFNWRKHTPTSYDDCLLKAVPAVWAWSPEQHAAELEKSIADNTPRNQLTPEQGKLLAAHLNRRPSDDLGLPSDSEASS